MGVDGQIGRGNLWYLTVEASHAEQVCLTIKGGLGTFYRMEPWDRDPEHGRIYSLVFVSEINVYMPGNEPGLKKKNIK